MKRSLAGIFLLLSLLISPVANAAIDITTPAEEVILIDMGTGDILIEKNADAPMPTSSMSKTMTIYALFKALEEGRISLNDTMKVSEKAWRKGGSKMFVEVGDKVKVEDLIKGVIVQSGNDAAIVLAEGLSGTEDVFAQTITQMAHEMGMENSHFANASGWPDPEHYSTARDLATLAQHLIRDFPQYYHYFGIKEFTYNDITQPNRNPLLYRNMGVDGLKTGHTEAAGYGLMASGIRDGRRLVLVVNGLDSAQMRASEGARLLEWGFSSFEHKTLFKAGDVVSDVDIVLGQEKTVPVTVEDDVVITLYQPKKEDLKVTVEYTDPIYAPVEKGDKIGTLKVEAPGMKTDTYDLVAQTGVRELGFFPKVMTKLTYMVMGKF